MLGAVEVDGALPDDLQPPPLADGRVRGGQVSVLDSELQDLPEHVDLHVDRAWRERLLDAVVAAPALVDDLDHQWTAGVDRGLADGVFSDLVLAVAVDLLDIDRFDQMVLEERDQVVAQFVSVVAGGLGFDFENLGVEPVRRRTAGSTHPPRAPSAYPARPGAVSELDVAEHDRKLAFCPRQCPSVLGAPEREIAAFAVGGEPQREAGLLGRRAPFAFPWLGDLCSSGSPPSVRACADHDPRAVQQLVDRPA